MLSSPEYLHHSFIIREITVDDNKHSKTLIANFQNFDKMIEMSEYRTNIGDQALSQTETNNEVVAIPTDTESLLQNPPRSRFQDLFDRFHQATKGVTFSHYTQSQIVIEGDKMPRSPMTRQIIIDGDPEIR